jgi:ABC-type multidrug transport system fused ATPase/permease subunit
MSEPRAAEPLPPVRPEGARSDVFPNHIFRFVMQSSGWHQLVLLVLSTTVFLIEVAPLELQRRIVNDIVKDRSYKAIILLCAIYAGVVTVHGATKLVLNVYRGWVGEKATRELRRRVHHRLSSAEAAHHAVSTSGVGVAMMVGEVEPIGGFVGESVSEPILQAGILLSVIAYMIHVEPLLAVATLTFFIPQLVFVPLLQGAINRRSAVRVWVLRQLSINLLLPSKTATSHPGSAERGIERVFSLNMGIFRLKFSMNFLMNLCNHLQIITALLVGAWFVLTDQLEIGGVVAFISAIGRLNDPWGDLVNYFRDVTNTQVKYRLLAEAANAWSQHRLAISSQSTLPSEAAR